MDFTFKVYEKLLNTLLAQGFSFLTITQYMEAMADVQVEEQASQPHFSNTEPRIPNPEPRTHQQINKSTNQPTNKLTTQQANKLIILRHDVEARYPNALRMAQIQHMLGIKGSYYFRISHEKGNEIIIKQIAALGHEIGYHYDDLSVCNGNHQKALQRFQKNLTYLRQFAPVTTITMEGAPLSKYDNRNLWSQTINKSTNQQINKEQINKEQRTINESTALQTHYSHFGIIAEPYFDLNFNEILYLTDTGRRWDGHRYNVRDKATKVNPVTNPDFLKLRFHSTFDLINAIESSNQQINPEQIYKSTPQQINKEQINKSTKNKSTPQQINNLKSNTFPPHAMLNFHPQRWNDKPLPWLKELIWQNVKNQGKRLLLALHK